MTFPITIDIYLHYQFKFANRDGSTAILFYIEEEHIRVYRNQPFDDVKISSKLPPRIARFMNEAWDGTEQGKLPKDFVEELSIPAELRNDLEEELRNIYRLENINDLSNFSPLRMIKVNETKLLTRLSKLPEEDGVGYRIHINYL